MRKEPIDEILLSAQVMIENSLSDSGISAALLVYGYSSEKLLIGKRLYEEALALQNAQKKEYGERAAATAELKKAWETADRQYMKALKIARVAFKDNVKADKAMMLDGIRKQSLPGWLEQARAFYTNILQDDELTMIFSQYGYSGAKLKEEFNLVEQVAAKSLRRMEKMGEAQEATVARDKKLDELTGWVSGLRAVAKVALDENPQWLEKLGILARTGGGPIIKR